MRAMKYYISGLLFCLASTLMVESSLAAGPTAVSDIGDIDPQELAKILPSKPPYSPYAGVAFPSSNTD